MGSLGLCVFTRVAENLAELLQLRGSNRLWDRSPDRDPDGCTYTFTSEQVTLCLFKLSFFFFFCADSCDFLDRFFYRTACRFLQELLQHPRQMHGRTVFSEVQLL